MRTRSIIAVPIVLAVVFAAFLLWSSSGQSVRPAIAMGVLSCTNHYGGGFLLVRIGITNVGPVTIGYNRINWGRDTWVRSESVKGWSTNNIGPSIDAPMMGALLKPGASTTATLVLPPGTLRWQVGYKVRAASLRQRFAWNVRGRWLSFLLPVFERLLPKREGPEQEIDSQLFEHPHNQPPAAGGGMPIESFSRALWPTGAEAEC